MEEEKEVSGVLVPIMRRGVAPGGGGGGEEGFLNRPVYSKQSQTAIADFAVKKVDAADKYTGATAG